MDVNDKYIVKIIDQETNGRGVAKINNLTVFVNNALINDTCEIVITKVKKNYAEADVINIIEQSNERIENDCPFFPSCGGCDLRHQAYLNQLQFKQKKVINAIERIGKLKDISVLNVIPSEPYFYRNKVTLKVNDDKLGFYKRGSYEIIDIDYCLISNEKINNIIMKLKKFIKDYNHHNITEIIIRAEEEIAIDIVADNFIYNKEIINCIIDEQNLISISINNKVIYGKDYITVKLLNNTFKVSNQAFFQVNTKQTELLYKQIIEYAKLNGNETVLDLYCGVGTITCILSKYSKQVVGIEVVKEAIINAKENAELNHIHNIEFINDKVENIINEIKDKIDIIVLDPPRHGSDLKSLKSIMEIYPQKIIYVSCNPETLARDLNILSNKYNINEITPFDMFPNTNHIETISLLTRK